MAKKYLFIPGMGVETPLILIEGEGEVPDGALNVSLDGSGSGSGANTDNEMSFEDFKALVLSTGIPQDTIVSFKAGEVYDFSDFPVPVPAGPPTNLEITAMTNTTQRLDWTRGLGDFVLIVRRLGAPVIWTPTEDTEYIQAQDLGDDQVVAHVGSGIFYPMSSLTADTEYHYAAWEYNTNDVEFKYSATAATVSGTTFITEFGTGVALAVTEKWVTPTLEQQMVENESLKAFVNGGFMALVPRMYNFYSKCTGEDWRGINWKGASVATQALFEGGITQLADGGIDDDGTGYVNMQWVPSTQGSTQFTATDAGIFCVVRDFVSGVCNLFGIWKGATGPANFHVIPSSGGNMVSRLNNLNVTGVSSIANTTLNGIWCAEVRALNTVYVSVNDTVLVNGTVTGAGVALPNVNFVAMARNNSAAAPVIDLICTGKMDCIFPYKPTSVDREGLKDWWEAHKALIDAL